MVLSFVPRIGVRRLLVVGLIVFSGLAWAGIAHAATVWSGSGTGTTSVVSDGTLSPAKFTYSVHDSCCASGNWTFSTTADASGSVVLNWSYSGFNAYFAVTVGLNAFVTHLGVTTTTSLVDAGPVNCCSSPSSGFSYSGTTTLTVAVGDTYGFTFKGSNGDSDGTLKGTLTVTVTDPPVVTDPPAPAPPQRVGYCAAAGDTNGDTGQPITPGTFLNLLSNQPEEDPHYLGATPAIWVEGYGITCDPPPPGYLQDGYNNGYAYYVAPVTQ